MDPAYSAWLWLSVGSALLGLFVGPRTVGIIAVCCFLVAVIGLVLCSALTRGTEAMLFGIAAMAVPVTGAIAFIGSFVGSRIRSALERRAPR